MKKLMMIFGMGLLLGSGCAEEESSVDQGPVVLHKQYMEPGTEEPYNGERVIQDDSGNLKTKAIYINGYPETVTFYYANQQERIKLVVAGDGKGEVKTHTEWYEQGQKKFERHDNSLKEWHKNGQLKADVPYDDSGDLHGIAKTWDAEGNLTGEEHYKHGALVESADAK